MKLFKCLADDTEDPDYAESNDNATADGEDSIGYRVQFLWSDGVPRYSDPVHRLSLITRLTWQFGSCGASYT